MKKKLVYLAFLILPGIILINSCTRGYNTISTTNVGTDMGGGMDMMASVVIQNMAFMPDTLMVKTGATVTWSNMDMVTHTVTDIGGQFDSGDLAAGQMYQYTFMGAGTFTYRSTKYPMMKTGVILVSN